MATLLQELEANALCVACPNRDNTEIQANSNFLPPLHIKNELFDMFDIVRLFVRVSQYIVSYVLNFSHIFARV